MENQIPFSSSFPFLSTPSNNNLENGNCSESRIPASSVLSFTSTTSSADVCVESDGNNADGTREATSTSFLSLKRPNDETQELCSVCNDIATGFHYGTPSCNGCKTFFRRTVMKKQVFQCQFDGNCPVDKNVRCACRHCRFKKCLEAGMSKESIQNNRDPIGYTKRTRRILNNFPPLDENASTSSGITADTSTNSLIANNGMPSFPSSSQAQVAIHSFMNNGINNNAQVNRPQTSSNQQQQTSQPVAAEHVQEDLMLQRLFGIEYILLTIRNSKLNVQKSLNDLLLNSSLFEDPATIKKMAGEALQMPPTLLRRAEQKDHLFWHERDWFIMIEWAKMLPVYQQLDLKDKLSLLRHSAITFPSLVQCFYTPDVGPDTIVFPDGAFFDRTMGSDKSLGFQRKNFKMLDNLLDPIRRIKIDQNEFAGAKAVFFLNPDSDADDLSLAAKTQISAARSAITNALYRYMVQKRGPEEAADKFGKLMMLLGTAIATMSCEMREAVIVADFFDQIQFSDFARQILFSNNCNDVLSINNSIQQQSAITNFPNYNLNNNSISSLTNNSISTNQQQQISPIFGNFSNASDSSQAQTMIPSSSQIIPAASQMFVPTPQTSINAGMLFGNNPSASASASNTPINVLNGLSNYFANGMQQQTQQQTPLPQLQQNQQLQQRQISNFAQMQQLHFSQISQMQQHTNQIQFNNSFQTSLNASALQQQQQNFRQIQLQPQQQQQLQPQLQPHFQMQLQQQLQTQLSNSSSNDSRQTTFVPSSMSGEILNVSQYQESHSQQQVSQQVSQQQMFQQQQNYFNQPSIPYITPQNGQSHSVSQPTSLRQPTPQSQTNSVRQPTPLNSVVSPTRPISRHPTPQQLAGTNWQQSQLVQNQNNTEVNQTQFEQTFIYQTKLTDASTPQKVFQDQQPFTPIFFSGPNSANSTAQSQPASAQSQNSSPPSIVNIQ